MNSYKLVGFSVETTIVEPGSAINSKNSAA